MLSSEQKNTFDRLNKTSYLFRLNIERNGLELSMKELNGYTACHVLYRCHVIGTVSFREEYTNFTLYKYLKRLFPKLTDFKLSEYFDEDHTKFLYGKFDAYVQEIKDALDTIPCHDSGVEDDGVKESMEDVRARLLDFIASDDFADSFPDSDSLPMNILRHDISAALIEIDRLHRQIDDRQSEIFKIWGRL